MALEKAYKLVAIQEGVSNKSAKSMIDRGLVYVGNKKVMMLVGPTGVGKTTSIAKLAARYSFLMQKKYKVGLIVLDTYRIGAVEQLMQYARMMKLPIEAVVDPTDFEEALNRLRGNDIILIDTVGSSQHDREKLEKLNRFSDVSTYATIETNLVLSATTKYEDLKDIYENFSILGIDTLITTKLDETYGFGNIFSLIYCISMMDLLKIYQGIYYNTFQQTL